MPRLATLALALCLALACPAIGLAAEGPHAEDRSQTLRGFTLRNETGQDLVQAQARTTKGKQIDITAGGRIASSNAQNFVVEQSECLDSVTVKLQDGHTLTRDHLNDCSDPRIVARADGLTVESGAGGPVHPSPASRANTGARPGG